MPISLDPLLMREIIMDNYENPKNKREVNDSSYLSSHMDSASCIDDIYVQVKVEGQKIKDIAWHGKGCAISTASTSIMTKLVNGKSAEEAGKIYEEFDRMLKGQKYDAAELGEAQAFKNTGRQPSRVSCATIGWRGLFKALGIDGGKED